MILKMFDGNDLPHELLLTTSQKTKLRDAFNNKMSTDIKFSKAQISKIIQSGGFLGPLLSKLAGPLMKFAVPLAKLILAPLGITAAAASAIDAGIQNKIHGSGTTTLIISNKKMNDIIKIVQALEDSNICWKELLKQLKMKQKNKKEDSLVVTLRSISLGNLLSGKGIVGVGYSCSLYSALRNNQGQGIISAGHGSKITD